MSHQINPKILVANHSKSDLLSGGRASRLFVLWWLMEALSSGTLTLGNFPAQGQQRCGRLCRQVLEDSLDVCISSLSTVP